MQKHIETEFNPISSSNHCLPPIATLDFSSTHLKLRIRLSRYTGWQVFLHFETNHDNN